MKTKIALLGLVILLSSFSELSAQWYVGGNMTLYGSNSDSKQEGMSNNDENKQSQFSINPMVGYFISDNFMVGLGIGFRTSIYEYKYYSQTIGDIDYYSRSENTNKTLSIAPFVRYYLPISEKISLYNHLELSYGFSDIYSAYYTENSGIKNYSEGKGKGIGIVYLPGLSINITEKFLLELGVGALGYSHDKSESTPKFEDTNSGAVNDGTKETSTSGNYYLSYNNFSLGLAFKF